MASTLIRIQERVLPKRNYGFEKRQKELAKQRKKKEKAQRKLDRKAADEGAKGEPPQSDDEPSSR